MPPVAKVEEEWTEVPNDTGCMTDRVSTPNRTPDPRPVPVRPEAGGPGDGFREPTRPLRTETLRSRTHRVWGRSRGNSREPRGFARGDGGTSSVQLFITLSKDDHPLRYRQEARRQRVTLVASFRSEGEDRPAVPSGGGTRVVATADSDTETSPRTKRSDRLQRATNTSSTRPFRGAARKGTATVGDP